MEFPIPRHHYAEPRHCLKGTADTSFSQLCAPENIFRYNRVKSNVTGQINTGVDVKNGFLLGKNRDWPCSVLSYCIVFGRLRGRQPKGVTPWSYFGERRDRGNSAVYSRLVAWATATDCHDTYVIHCRWARMFLEISLSTMFPKKSDMRQSLRFSSY